MRIVVLVKPVPDPASGGERLGPDGRLDRAAVPGRRQRQRRIRPRGGAQARRGARRRGDARCRWRRRTRPRRCARRSRWAPTRGVHVTDPALAGSDAVSTAQRPRRGARGPRVRPRPRRRRHVRRGRRASCPAGVAALLRLPYLSYAAKIEPDTASRHRPRPAHQPDRLRRARGADARGHRRARRRSASRATRRSRGSWPPASKEIVDAVAGATSGSIASARRRRGRDDRGPRQHGSRRPGPRREVVRGTPGRGRRAGSSTSSPSGGSSDGRAVGRRPSPGADGGLAKHQRRGRHARPRRWARRPAATSSGSSSRPIRRRRAEELATYLPRRLARSPSRRPADHAWSAVAAGHIAASRRRRRRPTSIFVGAGADGRDLAGAAVGADRAAASSSTRPPSPGRTAARRSR